MQHQIQQLADANPDGQFVVFEGPDKVGKTTLMVAVAARLAEAGKSVVTQREPGGTQMSEELRTVIDQRRDEKIAPETDIMLHMAIRRQNVVNTIIPNIQLGHVVLSDRFQLSTYAYNVIPHAQTDAQNDPLTMVFLGLMQVAIEGLIFEPLTIMVTLPEEQRQQRLAAVEPAKASRYETMSPEQTAKTLAVYKKYAEAPNYVVVDGTMPLDVQVDIVIAAMNQNQASQTEQVEKARSMIKKYEEQLAAAQGDQPVEEKVEDQWTDATPIEPEVQPTDEELLERYIGEVITDQLYADDARREARLIAGKELFQRFLAKTFEIVPKADFLRDHAQKEEVAKRFRAMEYYRAMHDDTVANLDLPVEELKEKAAARVAAAQEHMGLREASPEEVAEARKHAE